jgi:monooxygenase
VCVKNAINSGKADVVTDHIDVFTETGIKLKSGRILDADIIVTATGLVLEVLGGMQVAVDGKAIDFSKTLCYKGMMYSDVPNLASALGYTNASWTLKADLTCGYVCRLLNYMDEHAVRQCTPRNSDASIATEPFLDFSSGYVVRAMDKFPKQGTKAPWKLYQNYALDIITLKLGKVDDGVMEFSNPSAAPREMERLAS